MSTVIIFMSKHGTTEKMAKLIQEKLSSENVSIVNLKSNSNISLENFDAIILGGSIHAGQIQGKMKKFCDQNLDVLLGKKLGLFLCCMDKEKGPDQFENGFPKELREHSIAKGVLGGEFIFENMNFVERFLVKKIAHITKSKSEIDNKAIDQFIEDFKRG